MREGSSLAARAMAGREKLWSEPVLAFELDDVMMFGRTARDCCSGGGRLLRDRDVNCDEVDESLSEEPLRWCSTGSCT